MEKMILNRLTYIVGPLHHNLMGSTQGRGTTDAIGTLGKIASDAKFNRSGPKTKALKMAFAIFIDFEKAFELANSTVILHTLAHDKGVKGNLLGWLKDFLTERKGYCTVLGQKSETLPLHNGTPQGAVLSPYLFNILMDKLLHTIYSQLPEYAQEQITVVSYADDIVLTSNHFFSKHILELALHLLESTSTLLGLQINTSKTKAMAWNHSQKFPNFQFNVYGAPIEWVRTFKYLGVTFDDTLSFTEHVDDVVRRATNRINLLKHMASSPYGATQRTLLHYYKACIRPILEYGSIVLLAACPSALTRLETIQNTALKVALRLPKHTKSELVRVESGCMSLMDRIDSLAVTAYSKFKANQPNHPYFQCGKEMHSDPSMLGKSPCHSRDIPLDMLLCNISETINIPKLVVSQALATNPLAIPAWKNITFSFTKMDLPKHMITAEQAKRLRTEIECDIEKRFSSHMQLYVDGSVDPEDGRAAAAFICLNSYPQVEKGVRITNFVSSTQAELAAIHLSLLNLLNTQSPPSKAVILCDSQPAILTLQRTNPDPLDQLSKLIFETIRALTSAAEFSLTIHWIPSHIGIPGNERVDEIANKTRSDTEIGYVVPVSLGQVKSCIRKYYSSKTRELFQTSEHRFLQSYLKINPSLTTSPVTFPDPLIQVWYNRLRVDSDQYCYIHNCHTLCYYCKDKFNSQHYLAECPVTSWLTFSHMLNQSEHNLIPLYRYAVILQKASRPESTAIFSKYVGKNPPKFQCTNKSHGLIS